MIVNYSDQKIIKGDKSIFLAGPTPRSEEVISWRKEAIEILKKNGYDGIVYVPEYSTNKPREGYEDQVLWERDGLMSSSLIIFWIPRSIPKMMGLTTNVEFGYYLHTNKVLYGRPDNSEKNTYLDWLYKYDYHKEPFNNLEKLLSEAINILKKE